MSVPSIDRLIVPVGVVVTLLLADATLNVITSATFWTGVNVAGVTVVLEPVSGTPTGHAFIRLLKSTDPKPLAVS